jgi:hypothetical protein
MPRLLVSAALALLALLAALWARRHRAGGQDVDLLVMLEPAHLSWVTYSDPKVAHCGCRREALDAAGARYATYRFPLGKLDRAVAQRVDEGEIRVYARRGAILGASAVGARAGEIVAELALAMQSGVSLRQLADAIHAYPTFALGARRVADQWYAQHVPVRLLRLFGALRGLRGRVAPVEPDAIV